MSAPRKTILVAGLGRFVAADPNAAAKFGPTHINRQMVADNIEQAKQAGFDCSSIDVNPNDAVSSLKELKDQLQAQHYDGFIIGFGLRGNKDFTALFEAIVNTAVEMNPKLKFGFSPAPDAVFETIKRIFRCHDLHTAGDICQDVVVDRDFSAVINEQ